MSCRQPDTAEAGPGTTDHMPIENPNIISPNVPIHSPSLVPTCLPPDFPTRRSVAAHARHHAGQRGPAARLTPPSPAAPATRLPLLLWDVVGSGQPQVSPLPNNLVHSYSPVGRRRRPSAQRPCATPLLPTGCPRGLPSSPTPGCSSPHLLGRRAGTGPRARHATSMPLC